MNQHDREPACGDTQTVVQQPGPHGQSPRKSSAQRRADSDARMRAQGQTRISLWLPVRLLESLDAIIAKAGDRDRADLIEKMLQYMETQLATGELLLLPVGR